MGTSRLIYIPVIHTQADMGSLAGPLKDAYLERYGEEQWLQQLKVVDQMWEGIKRRLLALELNFSETKLYQDGLPVCGKELAIVTEVAGLGSRNHQLLLELIQKGCILMGTESPELLRQEYHYLKGALEGRNHPQPFWQRLWGRHMARQLLHQRDRFIARRISETLSEGETGLLFMGIQHRVDRYLPTGLAVQYLFHRLPFQYTSRFAEAHRPRPMA